MTIIADSNDHTFHFKEPLGGNNEKYQHIRLVSFSIFNIWFTLKQTGEISVFNAQDTATVKRISEGNYSLNSLDKAIQDTLKGGGV